MAYKGVSMGRYVQFTIIILVDVVSNFWICVCQDDTS